MTEHHTSRRARTLNKDRTRQQSLRDRKKAAAAPTTHTVNRAIVHAFMVELKAQREQGIKVLDANLSVGSILREAQAYLTLATHAANSYSSEEVRKAIIGRVQREAPIPEQD